MNILHYKDIINSSTVRLAWLKKKKIFLKNLHNMFILTKLLKIIYYNPEINNFITYLGLFLKKKIKKFYKVSEIC